MMTPRPRPNHEPLQSGPRRSTVARAATLDGPSRRGPRLSRRSLIAGLACALLLACATAPCLAQGTIYYTYNTNNIDNSTTWTLRAMNADGSNDRLVYSNISTSPLDGQNHAPYAICSHASHNGALTWLVLLEDDPYNGAGLNYGYGTLYQVTVGANGATSLVRLSDFDINTRKVGLVCSFSAGAAWTFDDSFISFVVADFTGATPQLKIVRFPVDDLVTNGGVLIDETNVETVMVGPNLNGGLEHSWSPDGTLLAYHSIYTAANGTNYSQLILRNVATGVEQVLVDQGVSGIGVGSPEYAPDDNRIAFNGNGNVYTVAVSGGSLKLVTAGGTNKNGTTYTYSGDAWSPDSSGLAITMRTYFNSWKYYLEKVPSTGGTVTNLTPKNTANKLPRAWR